MAQTESGRCGEIQSSSPNCTRNAFLFIARRAWWWKPRAGSWLPFAPRSKAHCNSEKLWKARGWAYPRTIRQVSEQENHSEVVLSGARFRDGAGVVHCGIGELGERRAHAKREGEGTGGDESRL